MYVYREDAIWREKKRQKRFENEGSNGLTSPPRSFRPGSGAPTTLATRKRAAVNGSLGAGIPFASCDLSRSACVWDSADIKPPTDKSLIDAFIKQVFPRLGMPTAVVSAPDGSRSRYFLSLLLSEE
mmetsp:Transcript_32158/g.69692  ORF Transcript_32158/g.69692 Transcript_32158/m.69692 type:complete len:126 (+) Transcript_32158:2153-2530(+)